MEIADIRKAAARIPIFPLICSLYELFLDNLDLTKPISHLAGQGPKNLTQKSLLPQLAKSYCRVQHQPRLCLQSMFALLAV